MPYHWSDIWNLHSSLFNSTMYNIRNPQHQLGLRCYGFFIIVFTNFGCFHYFSQRWVVKSFSVVPTALATCIRKLRKRFTIWFLSKSWFSVRIIYIYYGCIYSFRQILPSENPHFMFDFNFGRYIWRDNIWSHWRDALLGQPLNVFVWFRLFCSSFLLMFFLKRHFVLEKVVAKLLVSGWSPPKDVSVFWDGGNFFKTNTFLPG